MFGLEQEEAVQLTKGSHHKPYTTQAFIITCEIFILFGHIALIVGVVKNCKFLLRIWLVLALGLCFVGIYLTILDTFGTYSPQYGTGVGIFFLVILYVFFMVLVWVHHQRGHEMETVIRTHRIPSTEDLVRDFQ